jgi:heptosyltransferase-2
MRRPKVLLIRLSSMGDLIVLTSTLSLLEEAGAEVHLLTKERFFPLFEGDPRVKGLIPFQRGIAGILRTSKDLRAKKFDYAFDLHVKTATLTLLTLSGAKHRAKYQKRILERRRAIRSHRKIEEIPVAHLYAEPMMRLMGLDLEVPDPEILRWAQPSIEPPEPYAVLVPGGHSRTKRWPEEHYRELSRLLSQREITPVLAGDSGDSGLCERIAANVVSSIDLCGSTDLLELAGLLRGARFVVANDSGPAHLTAALGTPLYVFFGPTDPTFGFRPRGGHVRVFEREMACRPCALHGEDRCPGSENLCLSTILPEEVHEAIEHDLENLASDSS